MKFADIDQAHALSRALATLLFARGQWATVALDSTNMPDALAYAKRNMSTLNLPDVHSDAEMNAAIVWGIINEYDGRIESAKTELRRLGVKVDDKPEGAHV